jgi:hypothetical protein
MDTYEAPWVGVLLDIGANRADMESAAQTKDRRWFGEGYTDDLVDTKNPVNQKLLEISERQYESRPNSWARLLAFVCNNVLFSETPDMLEDNLIDLAAICTAWVEDINRREKNAR